MSSSPPPSTASSSPLEPSPSSPSPVRKRRGSAHPKRRKLKQARRTKSLRDREPSSAKRARPSKSPRDREPPSAKQARPFKRLRKLTRSSDDSDAEPSSPDTSSPSSDDFDPIPPREPLLPETRLVQTKLAFVGRPRAKRQASSFLIDKLLSIKALAFHAIAFLPYHEQVRFVCAVGGHGFLGRSMLESFYKNNHLIHMASLPVPVAPLPARQYITCVSRNHPVPLHDRGKHVISYLDVRFPCETVARMPEYLLKSVLNMRLYYCVTALALIRAAEPLHVIVDYESTAVRDLVGLAEFATSIPVSARIVTQVSPALPPYDRLAVSTSSHSSRSLVGHLYNDWNVVDRWPASRDVVMRDPEHFPMRFYGAMRVAIGFIAPMSRNTRVVFYQCRAPTCGGLGAVHLHNKAKSTQCGPCRAREHHPVARWECRKTHSEKAMGGLSLCRVCETMREYLRSFDGKSPILSYDTLLKWVDERAEFKRDLSKHSVQVRSDRMPSLAF